MPDGARARILVDRLDGGLHLWRVIGVRTRSTRRGNLVLLPTGITEQVAEGWAITGWGARRAARKALLRHCGPPPGAVVSRHD